MLRARLAQRWPEQTCDMTDAITCVTVKMSLRITGIDSGGKKMAFVVKTGSRWES